MKARLAEVSTVRIAVVGALTAMLLAMAAVAANAVLDSTPPVPGWVNGDGTIDLDSLPETFDVLDQNGEVIDTVPASELFSPPDGTRGIEIVPDGLELPDVEVSDTSILDD